MDDRAARNRIVFVLRTGIPWEDLPQGLGFGSGMTCWRRLCDWQDNGPNPTDRGRHGGDRIYQRLEDDRVMAMGPGHHQRQWHPTPVYDEMAFADEPGLRDLAREAAC